MKKKKKKKTKKKKTKKKEKTKKEMKKKKKKKKKSPEVTCRYLRGGAVLLQWTRASEQQLSVYWSPVFLWHNNGPWGQAGSCCDRRRHDCTEQGLSRTCTVSRPSPRSITDKTNTTLRYVRACKAYAANMHAMCERHQSCMSRWRLIHARRHIWHSCRKHDRADNTCKNVCIAC